LLDIKLIDLQLFELIIKSVMLITDDLKINLLWILFLSF